MIKFALSRERPYTCHTFECRYNMPITWEDEAQQAYEVYVKGQQGMGPFANLMERVEYIGREIVYRYYKI